MKFLLSTILTLVSLALFAQSQPNYEIIFQEATSHTQRRILFLELLEDGVDLGDFPNRAFVGVYQDRYGTSIVGKIELMKLLIENLSAPLSDEVNLALINLYNDAPPAPTRHEIYAAWGRYNVDERFDFVLGRLVQILESQTRTFEEEIEAFSGVNSLGLYGRDQAIPILIRISEGWFSGRSGVKTLAWSTLQEWQGRGRQEILDTVPISNDIGITSVLVRVALRLFPNDPNEDFIRTGFDYGLRQVYDNFRDRLSQRLLLEDLVAEILAKNINNDEFGLDLMESLGLMDLINIRLEIIKALATNTNVEIDAFINDRLMTINRTAAEGGLTADLQREVNGILDLIEVRGGDIYVQALTDMRSRGYQSFLIERASTLARSL